MTGHLTVQDLLHYLDHVQRAWGGDIALHMAVQDLRGEEILAPLLDVTVQTTGEGLAFVVLLGPQGEDAGTRGHGDAGRGQQYEPDVNRLFYGDTTCRYCGQAPEGHRSDRRCYATAAIVARLERSRDTGQWPDADGPPRDDEATQRL